MAPTGPVHDPHLHDISLLYSPISPGPSTRASSVNLVSSSPQLAASSSGEKVDSIHLQELAASGTKKNVVIGRRSFGRPPWYKKNGQSDPAYVIGVAGGSASGKTSVAREILRLLEHVPNVLILSQDSFYRRHDDEEIALAFANELDFDHPDAIDFGLFKECLETLRDGQACEIPVYSFVHHQRMPETSYLYGASVIIVEGILALQDPALRELFDLKVFVNCDSDLMLARRIRRDVSERGRDVDGILDQYLRFVKPSYDNFVGPSQRYADIVVPGYSNNVAIDLIVTHIKKQLAQRSMRFREELSKQTSTPESEVFVQKVVVLEQTLGLQGLLTHMRNRDTSRIDFVHYCDRLSGLIVEKALSLLPYVDKTVITPVGIEAQGKLMNATNLVGISVGASGGPFEKGLRKVITDVRLGSLLIQPDANSGDPLLYNLSLPDCLKSRDYAQDAYVIICDSQMSTGSAALMAIRVILDHHVKESRILFVSFVIANQAAKVVGKAFPAVQIVTATIGDEIEKIGADFVIKNGFGNIGNRYYLND